MQSIRTSEFLNLSLPVLALTFGLSVEAADISGPDLVWSETARRFDANLAPMRLQVQGNKLLNAKGEAVWLRGVNIASLEWSNQGEHMDEAFHQAMAGWRANVIRMPVAQDRWFGKAAHQADHGAGYRTIVDRLVETCAGAGAYIDLDLHWSNTGKWSNEGGKLSQHEMPDQFSILFWRDVATRYKNHPNVIFGLYNEPHDVSWSVWRDGGNVSEKPSKRDTNQVPISYEAVGLQKLYDTVRSAGAENVVTISGLEWGYDLSGVLQGHAIQGTNIVYETHPYPFKKEWDKRFGAVSDVHPVFMGEWGGGVKDLDYGRQLTVYARAHHLHWTAWCFHPSCGPPLLRNWDFEPNDFGKFVKTALLEP
jgi:endoglucanase